MPRLFALVFAVTALLLGVLAAPALAHDHLFNAAHAPGVADRGFANPVAGNPSGVSGAAAQPATVPGAGDPKMGVDTGTPAVDLSLVNARSGGHGAPQAP
jgi:hypothetical protein